MRHKNNKSISFVLAIILMVNCMFLVNPFEVKAADHGSVVDCVPKEVEQYVVDNKQKVIESIKELSDFFDYEYTEGDAYDLLSPFMWVYLDEKQELSYDYPIVDCENGEIILVLSIVPCENGYTYQLSDNMVDVLNSIDYLDREYLFYGYEGKIFIECESGIVYTGKHVQHTVLSDSDYLDFAALSFYDKISAIKKYIADIQCGDANDGISLMSVELPLTNPQGQYNNKMCWASSAATIINYLKGKTVTGFEVCNKLGKGYNDGGTKYDIATALSYYGITYNVYNSKLSWSDLTSNINSGYPIAMSCTDADFYGLFHAVVLYGYNDTDKSIVIWDPDGNSSSGARVVANLTNGQYKFNSGSTGYYWTGSVAYK